MSSFPSRCYQQKASSATSTTSKINWLKNLKLHERNLGVWTTNYLTWLKQVAVQAITANEMLGLVCRTLKDVTDSCVCRTGYLEIVRPRLGLHHLGYGHRNL